MASTINTNVQSLTAQRNLGASQNSLSTSMQRLSSGLRINSAKDDAAGLSISERMGTQVRGLNQAARNANDGVSMAQTAEGSLGTIGNNLQRIRELAVQSRNSTNSDDDRAAMQKEVKQLVEEVDRVANNTNFNGTNLLDGTFTQKAFQVGANQGQTIKIDNIVSAKSEDLGSWTSASTKTYAYAAGAAASFTNPAEKASLNINGVKIGIDAVGGRDATTAAAALKTAFDTAAAKPENAQALAGITMAADGAITVAARTSDVKVTGLTNVAGIALGVDGTTTTAGTANTGFDDVDISTEVGADNAILAMDAALKSVNSARADLGALQNRFSSVVDNLNVNSENLSASRSRIMDADFAQETSNLSRAQILQQAGTAMVAQANQLPQGVLSLLR